MRSTAREVVYKFIFSKLFNSDNEGLFDVLLNVLESDNDKNFAKTLLDAVVANDEQYEKTISELSHNFKFDRLLKPDLCALKIGMAELDCFPETPVPVVIDEAIKLTVKYSTDKSPDYVNGVLAAYVKRKGRG